jgi:hypothetical protein
MLKTKLGSTLLTPKDLLFTSKYYIAAIDGNKVPDFAKWAVALQEFLRHVETYYKNGQIFMCLEQKLKAKLRPGHMALRIVSHDSYSATGCFIALHVFAAAAPKAAKYFIPWDGGEWRLNGDAWPTFEELLKALRTNPLTAGCQLVVNQSKGLPYRSNCELAAPHLRASSAMPA